MWRQPWRAWRELVRRQWVWHGATVISHSQGGMTRSTQLVTAVWTNICHNFKTYWLKGHSLSLSFFCIISSPPSSPVYSVLSLYPVSRCVHVFLYFWTGVWHSVTPHHSVSQHYFWINSEIIYCCSVWAHELLEVNFMVSQILGKNSYRTGPQPGKIIIRDRARKARTLPGGLETKNALKLKL